MRRLAIGLVSSIACFALSGCLLGRTGIGLEDQDADGVPFDGGTDDSGVLVDGQVLVDGVVPGDDAIASDGSPPVDTGRDTFIDIFDAFPFPIPDSGPIGACASCVRDNCGGQVNACINSAKCRAGLLCTVQKCLGGSGPGGFDIGCVLGCFDNDFSQAQVAIQTFTCVLGKCGTQCGGLLGGLGGGGGFPGGAQYQANLASMNDVQSIDPNLRMAFSPEAFAPWARELRTSCAPGPAICR